MFTLLESWGLLLGTILVGLEVYCLFLVAGYLYGNSTLLLAILFMQAFCIQPILFLSMCIIHDMKGLCM